MAKDAFEGLNPGLQSPALVIEEITPDDLTDLANVTRALNVAVSGTVRVMTLDGAQADVFVAAGTTFPVRVCRVLATGTSATGIRGLS